MTADTQAWTGGPWKHNGTVGVHAPDGTFIATTKRPNGMMKTPPADQQVANASLIAAAPAMYEALEAYHKHFGPLEDNHMLNEDCRRCAKFADAALKHARGESP